MMERDKEAFMPYIAKRPNKRFIEAEPASRVGLIQATRAS